MRKLLSSLQTLNDRDKRLLLIWIGLLVVAGGYYFWTRSGPELQSATSDSVDVAEQRLLRLRKLAAAVPAKQDVLKKVNAELALREKGLIRADTGPQAQAQLIQILRQLSAKESIDLRGFQFGGFAPLGDSYGVANLTVQVECHIEQLLNLLAAMEARPELIYPQDIQISASNPKEKTVRVLLSIAGAVPKALAVKPGAKGGSL